MMSRALIAAALSFLVVSPAAAGTAAPSTTQPASLKLIRGQHTEFMWQGLSAVPDNAFNDACAKQQGKVLKHPDGKWYCDSAATPVKTAPATH